jgi:hypothetical protein
MLEVVGEGVLGCGFGVAPGAVGVVVGSVMFEKW